jgi:tetratricopeptide (TPR) repeat protein
VARGLEQVRAGDLDAVSSQIAVHWERAGQHEQAIVWYRRAAEAAQKMNADSEAARLLDRALAHLRVLAETPERGRREMTLLAAMPAILGMAEGYASTRLADVHARALALASEHGIELAPQLLRSLAVVSLIQGDFARARRFGDELRQRGEHDTDDVLRVEAEYVLGIAAFWRGEFAMARVHFETAVDRYRPEHRRAHLLQYGLDPKVVCLSRLGNTLWFLGIPEAATRARDAALELATEIGHLPSEATALVFATLLAFDMRDHARMSEDTAKLTSESAERIGRPPAVHGAAIAGYLDVLDGRASEGIARIVQALDQTRGGQHAPGMRASIVRLLLEAYALTGEVEAGLALTERALASGDAGLWESEALRLRAEFLAAADAPWDDVETHLKRAREVAQRQGARIFALRAVASTVRLLQPRGGTLALREARASLRALVDDLAEAAGTQDVLEARSLLR